MSHSFKLNKGEMNYIFYSLVLRYLELNGTNYQNISDTIGALQDCADEVKRRIMADYEQSCIIKNGDVILNE